MPRLSVVLVFSTILAGLVLCPTAARSQQAPAVQSSAACLVQYQVALDQLSRGHLDEARVTLRRCIDQYGSQPDINLLLGYVLGRQGNAREARQVLAPVAERSPLACSMAAQLQQLQPGSATASASSTAASGSAIDAPAGNATGDSLQTPIGGAFPAARLAQTNARLEAFESLLAGLVNQERVKAGLQPLTCDPVLAEVARAHSAEMRDLAYFAHESPTPGLRQPVDRFRAVFGQTPPVVAENVYRAWGGRHELTQEDIQAAHTAFMDSPGHRENILYPQVTRLGIGIVTNMNGDIWVTEMFTRVERMF